MVPYGKFTPKTTRISRGTKVTWKVVGTKHTSKAYRGRWTFNSKIDLSRGTLAPNHVSFIFRRSGTYYFRGRYHSILSSGGLICGYMCGKIVVS